ncbi:TetR/AcrR family transcriptional regulator [Arthrobacter sp. 35W]|uniref:TetR/AcrR family transcriptional regulator n=1 Tax=Arthrobacter sp. 35W TaxID=1132441 RepID=UPI0004165BED|nr:TetR family transcriptional regulator [Arthrobacter sp. 35W]
MTAKDAAPGQSRARRSDPDRRERIIAVALDVIAEHGIAGTTHRRVAQAADVPLGSMTYHFKGIEDLLAAAFTLLANQTADGFEAALSAAATREEAVDAVVGLITSEMLGNDRAVVLTHELYSLAARRPDMRRVTDAWMARSRDALQRHFDPETATMVDALIEGLTIHRSLALNPLSTQTVVEAVKRIATIP